MAEMVPDSMPSGASAGEKRLFSVLQRLPDDCVVYYEPIVANRYPDFIVILPDLGLLVMEVKGWYPSEIEAADSHSVTIAHRGARKEERHPLRQAREYMYGLMDCCRRHPEYKRLLNDDGRHEGRFIFPFGFMAILSNISSSQLNSHPKGDLSRIFPPSQVVPRDVFHDWDALSGAELCSLLATFFDPRWPFPRLDGRQVDTLRAVIHPEVRLFTSPVVTANTNEPSQTPPTVAVLDLRQERHARSIGEGHRVVYGVAGSGKTTLLISRAKLLAAQNSESKGLFLCYNVALAAYLRTALADCPNIYAMHFDGWSRENGVTRGRGESDSELGERLLAKLANGHGDSRKYDSIFVDEGQDFEATWFKCVVEALAEPLDGNLVVVSDASQGLYRRHAGSWSSVGIQARGRSLSKQFDLDKNYRNTREILELASTFASAPSTSDEDGMLCVPVDPASALRSTGVKPILLRAPNRRVECSVVVNAVKDLLRGCLGGKAVSAPIPPGQIGILYPYVSAPLRDEFRQFLESLRRQASVIWISDPDNRDNRARVTEAGIKVQTIHSAKGLQYRAVVLLWADLLPKPFGEQDIEKDRKLMYVGLTRPEDFLIVSASGPSTFIDELEKSGRLDVVLA